MAVPQNKVTRPRRNQRRSHDALVAGNPADWGAQVPHDNVFAAGITQSQGFLPAVSEGRIATRPWIERIEGDTVRFADGSAERVDGILFGTGYALSLPFLAPEAALMGDAGAVTA